MGLLWRHFNPRPLWAHDTMGLLWRQPIARGGEMDALRGNPAIVGAEPSPIRRGQLGGGGGGGVG